jgi:hypothetical protein
MTRRRPDSREMGLSCLDNPSQPDSGNPQIISFVPRCISDGRSRPLWLPSRIKVPKFILILRGYRNLR